MALDIENLKTRRSAIYAELAALSASKKGGGINSSGAGTSVDHRGYKQSLYDEIKEINSLILSAEGPYDEVIEML